VSSLSYHLQSRTRTVLYWSWRK